jgi:hypothetical protein
VIFIYDEWNDWKSNCNIAMAALGLVGVTVIIAEVKEEAAKISFHILGTG